MRAMEERTLISMRCLEIAAGHSIKDKKVETNNRIHKQDQLKHKEVSKHYTRANTLNLQQLTAYPILVAMELLQLQLLPRRGC
jgi:hypothetical protein